MPVLETFGITKRFPGVLAVHDFSFSVEPGEVHALVGENGAGKSTLVKMLSGVIHPTSGGFAVDGVKMRFSSPRDASRVIGVVHQESEIIPHFNGYENLFLGAEFSSAGFLLNGKMRAVADKFLRQYRMNLDMNLPASAMSSGQQCMLSILKVLFRDPKVVILDEPTARLSVGESEVLFSLIDDLKKRGIAVLYISHKLREVLDISDRVTVMRNGCKVDTVRSADVDESALIRLMIARGLDNQYPKLTAEIGAEVFRAELPNSLPFSLRAGEIVGVAGLVGAGRTELAKAVYMGKLGGGVKLTLDGKPFVTHSPAESIKRGVVMVPEDRRGEGVIGDMNVAENLIMPHLDVMSRFGFVDSKKGGGFADSVVGKYAIKISGLGQMVKTLSGGNQQKVSVGKWSGVSARVWIFDEPTQGIDVDAKTEIYSIMGKIAQGGAAVWFISSDMRELLAVSDRVYAMRSGRVAAEMRPPYDNEKLLAYMMGQTEGANI